MRTHTRKREKKKACERTMCPSPNQVLENNKPLCEVLCTLCNASLISPSPNLEGAHTSKHCARKMHNTLAQRWVNKVSYHGNREYWASCWNRLIMCSREDARNNDLTTFKDKSKMNLNFRKCRRNKTGTIRNFSLVEQHIWLSVVWASVLGSAAATLPSRGQRLSVTPHFGSGTPICF